MKWYKNLYKSEYKIIYISLHIVCEYMDLKNDDVVCKQMSILL